MYDTQNYWVSVLCQLFQILNTKQRYIGKWICFCPQVRGGRHLLYGFP
jgi:hypothetical protein